MGEAITRHSLLPLIDEGHRFAQLGQILPRECVRSPQPRHCEERSDEAIQTTSAGAFWIASLRSQ